MKYITIMSVCFVFCMQTHAQSKTSDHQQTEQGLQQHLKIYPTVADKYVNIYVDFEVPTDFSLTIPPSDKNNEKKWSVSAKSSYQHSLDVADLPEGKYMIRLESDTLKEVVYFSIKR